MTRFGSSTLFGLIHHYLKVYLPKQRKLSTNTIRSYREALELLVDFVKVQKGVPLQDVTFEMLTGEIVTAYLDHLENDRHCGIATRNSRLAAVRAFFVYAADRDVTTAFALTDIKNVPVKKPVHAMTVDYMSMAAITAIVEQTNVETPKGFRDRVFIILMYDAGARIQEMIDIKLCDLRLNKTPTIILHGKGSKIRSVPLMEKTVLHLHKYLSVFHAGESLYSQSPLFYSEIRGQINPLSDRRIRYLLKDYGVRAREHCPQVPENVHPHLFRHSRAMHLYQQGMDLTLVSQWLGHANLETTQVYAHADTEHKRKAIESATPADNPLHAKLSPERFTISDEDMLKRLMGLR
jgi:site-specific recombinase XerD